MQMGEVDVIEGMCRLWDQVGEQTARGDGTGPREDRGERQETSAAADLASSTLLGTPRARVEGRRSALLRNTCERIGTNVATLAMTRHILMRNGIEVPQVVARCAKSRTPVARLTIRPTVTAGKTQRKARGERFG
jgi:hypothetical protein